MTEHTYSVAFGGQGAPGVPATPLISGAHRIIRTGVPLFAADMSAWLLVLGLSRWTTGGPRLNVALLLVTITVFLLYIGRFYRTRLNLSVLDYAPGVAVRSLLAAAGMVMVLNIGDEHGAVRLLELAAGFALASLAGRTVVTSALRSKRAAAASGESTLIVGAGTVGCRIADILLSHPEYGLRPVGFFDDDPLPMAYERPIPFLGSGGDLNAVVDDLGVRNVIVAFGRMRETAAINTLRRCEKLNCEIFVVPRLYEMQAPIGDAEFLWGIPVVRLRRNAFRGRARRMKRIFDVSVSLSLLCVLSPVLAACALAVRLTSGPGVLFRQQRVGLDGRAFTLYKFRTLRPDHEAEASTTWTVADDPRVNVVGRFLRRTSLDELPQLVNILRGDMSVVGPRPERPHFVDRFHRENPGYMARHRVPCGLTGYAQVHGLRGDTSIIDRAIFDNYYIENWSMWNDVKIILRTAGQVVRGAGS